MVPKVSRERSGGGAVGLEVSGLKGIEEETSSQMTTNAKVGAASFEIEIPVPSPEEMCDDPHDDHDDDQRRQAAGVAFSMWLGLLLDGIPESLLIGFMTNSSKIEMIFVAAIFMANFPEAYSAAAILYGQGIKATKIMGMWGIVFVMTGCLAAFGSWCMPKDTHGNPAAQRFEERAGAIMEGITGGSMMAMIATAMLPEAFHQAGSLSGLLFVVGFGAAHQLAGFGLTNSWQPPCSGNHLF